jgi:hypothetical protein
MPRGKTTLPFATWMRFKQPFCLKGGRDRIVEIVLSNIMEDNKNKLEHDVLHMLLSGGDPILSIIRRQLDNAVPIRTELSGMGFFTYFEVSERAPRIPGSPSFSFGDVIGEIEGLERGVGFHLFIDKGVMTMLEGYTYDEPWPHKVGNFELKYISGNARDLSALKEAPEWPCLTPDRTEIRPVQ